MNFIQTYWKHFGDVYYHRYIFITWTRQEIWFQFLCVTWQNVKPLSCRTHKLFCLFFRHLTRSRQLHTQHICGDNPYYQQVANIFLLYKLKTEIEKKQETKQCWFQQNFSCVVTLIAKTNLLSNYVRWHNGRPLDVCQDIYFHTTPGNV